MEITDFQSDLQLITRMSQKDSWILVNEKKYPLLKEIFQKLPINGVYRYMGMKVVRHHHPWSRILKTTITIINDNAFHFPKKSYLGRHDLPVRLYG